MYNYFKTHWQKEKLFVFSHFKSRLLDIHIRQSASSCGERLIIFLCPIVAKGGIAGFEQFILLLQYVQNDYTCGRGLESLYNSSLICDKRRNCSFWPISTFATKCSQVDCFKWIKLRLHEGKGLNVSENRLWLSTEQCRSRYRYMRILIFIPPINEV